MSNKTQPKGKYISDQLEDQPWSQSMGQVQVLEAGKKQKTKSKIKDKVIKKLK